MHAIRRELATRPDVQVKKNHGGPFSGVGEPDLLIHWAVGDLARVAYIETKAPGSKPTVIQHRAMVRLAACGAKVFWTSSAAAIEWLEGLGLPGHGKEGEP